MALAPLPIAIPLLGAGHRKEAFHMYVLTFGSLANTPREEYLWQTNRTPCRSPDGTPRNR